MSTMKREIAIAIGHHFWKCDNDNMAAWCGNDAANDVMKRLDGNAEQAESVNDDLLAACEAAAKVLHCPDTAELCRAAVAKAKGAG